MDGVEGDGEGDVGAAGEVQLQEHEQGFLLGEGEGGQRGGGGGRVAKPFRVELGQVKVG